jgi:type IV secretion system protein VirB10
MRLHPKLARHFDVENDRDPRDERGAEVIDLATRNVLPTVTQRKRADGLGLVAGIAIVAALGGLTLWSMDAARTGQGQPAEVVLPDEGSALPGDLGLPPMPAPVAPAPPAALPAPAPQPVLAAPPQIAAAPVSNPHASPTVVFDASTLPTPLAVPGVPAPAAGTGNGNDDFASRLGLGGTGGGKAVADAAFDPKTTVTQGTLIPAVLETAIDTDVPGYVRAIVSTDVRSFDGSRVLVPRSSRLIGQYKSGLSAGQKRAYVIWTRLIRPDGVSVNIASPAVGFGGETGLAGKVDSHFFERFGSAMLLSVIGGLSAIGGNASVLIAGGGQSAAAAAVGQTGQISPTVRVRQGQPIRVFTAKDLDFSKVS